MSVRVDLKPTPNGIACSLHDRLTARAWVEMFVLEPLGEQEALIGEHELEPGEETE
jgi:hypothetical protein